MKVVLYIQIQYCIVYTSEAEGVCTLIFRNYEINVNNFYTHDQKCIKQKEQLDNGTGNTCHKK